MGPAKSKAYIEGLDTSTTYRCVGREGGRKGGGEVGRREGGEGKEGEGGRKGRKWDYTGLSLLEFH